ncbi:MAG: hypothetical protein WC861_05660 [Candidatus Micrarchaeia archaeon]|jgi:hypothetical protein
MGRYKLNRSIRNVGENAFRAIEEMGRADRSVQPWVSEFARGLRSKEAGLVVASPLVSDWRGSPAEYRQYAQNIVDLNRAMRGEDKLFFMYPPECMQTEDMMMAGRLKPVVFILGGKIDARQLFMLPGSRDPRIRYLGFLVAAAVRFMEGHASFMVAGTTPGCRARPPGA